MSEADEIEALKAEVVRLKAVAVQNDKDLGAALVQMHDAWDKAEQLTAPPTADETLAAYVAVRGSWREIGLAEVVGWALTQFMDTRRKTIGART